MIVMGLCHSRTWPASWAGIPGAPDTVRYLERSEYSHASCMLLNRVRLRRSTLRTEVRTA